MVEISKKTILVLLDVVELVQISWNLCLPRRQKGVPFVVFDIMLIKSQLLKLI